MIENFKAILKRRVQEEQNKLDADSELYKEQIVKHENFQKKIREHTVREVLKASCRGYLRKNCSRLD